MEDLMIDQKKSKSSSDVPIHNAKVRLFSKKLIVMMLGFIGMITISVLYIYFFNRFSGLEKNSTPITPVNAEQITYRYPKYGINFSVSKETIDYNKTCNLQEAYPFEEKDENVIRINPGPPCDYGLYAKLIDNSSHKSLEEVWRDMFLAEEELLCTPDSDRTKLCTSDESIHGESLVKEYSRYKIEQVNFKGKEALKVEVSMSNIYPFSGLLIKLNESQILEVNAYDSTLNPILASFEFINN